MPCSGTQTQPLLPQLQQHTSPEIPAQEHSDDATEIVTPGLSRAQSDDDDAQLQQALALSLAGDSRNGSVSPTSRDSIMPAVGLGQVGCSAQKGDFVWVAQRSGGFKFGRVTSCGVRPDILILAESIAMTR